MKVSEIEYKRVTKEDMDGAYAAFLAAEQTAQSADEVIVARERLLSAMKSFDTATSLAHSRFTLNTRDPFYKAEMDYYNEVTPLVESMKNKYYHAMLNSPYRKEMENKLGALLFLNLETAQKSHSDDCIAEEQEELTLTTQYSELMSEMTCEWEGKEIPLTVLLGQLENGDPKVRLAAANAIGRGLEKYREKLDGIYDRLVKVRDKIAKKMGYKNFVELGYYRMGRTGYNQDMVATFRKNVLQSLVPVIARFKASVKERLGLFTFRFSDNDVYTQEGNPAFTLSEEEAFNAAREMYAEMNGEIGKFFAQMADSEAFDVQSREGKCGGGYCTSFPDYHQEFIFANFNGTTGDVDVLTHEFGHAYAMHESERSGVDYELNIGGMETAECHSMSMEFLCWKFMDKFFGDMERAYRYKHLADSLSFIPYGCIVDEFQHIVYEHPELTPAERNGVYLELEKKYRPYLTYEGIDYLEEGTRWQFQMHVYESPFYYIDYCLAQTVALGFLVKSREDYPKALEKYCEFARTGGALPFNELVKRAEIAYPFGEGTLEKLGKQIESILHELQG